MTITEKEAALHCLRTMIDEELCEECPLYGTTGTDHCEEDCVRFAIKALEQIEKIKSIINDPFYFRDMPDYLLRYKAICELLKEAEHEQR